MTDGAGAVQPEQKIDLRKLLVRPVAFYPSLVPVAGSVNAAIMLCQALYWSERTENSDGSFWKTLQEWTRETGLRRHEQEGARKLLRGTSFWVERYERLEHRLFYLVDFDALEKAIIEGHANNPTSSPETVNPGIPESRKVEMGKAEKRKWGVPKNGNGECRIPEIVKEQRVLSESTSESTSGSASRPEERATGGYRQTGFSDVAMAMFVTQFKQKPAWGPRQYVELSRLLKRCPGLALEEFSRRYRHLLESPVEFHRQQGGDLAFFCTNFDKFILMPEKGSYGRDKQANLEANCVEGLRRFEARHRTVAVPDRAGSG